MPAIHDSDRPGRTPRSSSRHSAGEPPRAVVVFAHPLPTHGGTMHTKALYQGTKGLVRARCAVLRFNFRGVGKSAGEFERAAKAKKCSRTALDYVAMRYPGLPNWAAGFVVRCLDCARDGRQQTTACQSLIGIAPPVTKQGTTSSGTMSARNPSSWSRAKPTTSVPLQDMWKFYGELPAGEGAGRHRRRITCSTATRSEVGEALEDLLTDFETPATSSQPPVSSSQPPAANGDHEDKAEN